MIKVEITALNYCHRAHFEKSGRVQPVAEYGCYYCGQVYKLAEHPIQECVDGGQTALCPVCGIDAVIPKIKKLGFDDVDMERLRREMF